MYEDYYSETEEDFISKHSGFGIASFVIVLVAGTLELILVAIAGILQTATPGGIDEKSPIAILLGLVMIGVLFVDFMGIVFGVIGLFQRDRKKIFAVFGIVLGSLVILGFLFLLIVGLTMG